MTQVGRPADFRTPDHHTKAAEPDLPDQHHWSHLRRRHATIVLRERMLVDPPHRARSAASPPSLSSNQLTTPWKDSAAKVEEVRDIDSPRAPLLTLLAGHAKSRFALTRPTALHGFAAPIIGKSQVRTFAYSFAQVLLGRDVRKFLRKSGTTGPQSWVAIGMVMALAL